MTGVTRLQRLLLAGGAVVAAVGIGIAAFPSTVYDRFIWKYFWGPVVADALNQATATLNGVTAHPGYTAVSILVYAAVLLYSVAVLVTVFKRRGIGLDTRLVTSFVPFMVFGGLLRVVEDAALVSYPLNTFLISPIVYLVLGALGVALLLVSVRAEEREWVSSSHTAIRLIGGAAAVVTAAVLLLNSIPAARLSMLPVLIGAPLLGIAAAIVVQEVLARRWPDTFLDTGIGRIAVAAQVLDGTVTVIIVTMLGGTEKLPLSQAIIDAIHPAAFPAVKLGITLLFLGALKKEDADEIAALMLLVLIAVGLGPGTRNLARAVLGV